MDTVLEAYGAFIAVAYICRYSGVVLIMHWTSKMISCREYRQGMGDCQIINVPETKLRFAKVFVGEEVGQL